MRRFLRTLVAVYLRWLVGLTMGRHHPDVIAVAGITNKTTTKRAISERLQARGVNVRSNPKSYNTDIGLPLAILYLEPPQKSASAWLRLLLCATRRALFERRFPGVLVLEFGISAAGDMRALLNIVRPRIAVLTNVVPSAFNPAATLDELTNEFRLLIRQLPGNGYAAINADDAHLQSLAHEFPDRVITYAVHAPATVRATDVQQTENGLRFRLDGREMYLNRFGEHHLYAYLAAEALMQNFLS